MTLPPGARQARDKAGGHRIGDLCEDDRYAAALFQQGLQHQPGADQEHIRIEAHELFRLGADARGICFAPARVDADVAAVGPAQLLQRLPERREGGLHFRVGLGERAQHTNPAHPVLLRPRRQRPSRSYASEQPDEIPSSHSALGDEARMMDGRNLPHRGTGGGVMCITLRGGGPMCIRPLGRIA